MDENKITKDILGDFICANRYYSDMIFDLIKIIKNRTQLFKDKFSEYHKSCVDYALNKLSGLETRPKHKYRLYIICGLRYMALAYIDIPEEFIENILYGIDRELSEYDESDVKNLPLDFISTVYVFKNSKIIYSCHIGPDHLAWLTNIFKYENLIDDRQQYRWTENFSDYK